jgi:predicted AAA+ superfamily ATPase
MKHNSKSIYYISGGLPIDAPTYVSRDADEQLYKFLQASQNNNHACYILAPRQVGKSSLMIRTANRLSQEGEVCVQINMQRLGKVVCEDSLYFIILRDVCQKIKIINYNLSHDLDLSLIHI